MDIIEAKDKRTKKVIEYLIHFQGKLKCSMFVVQIIYDFLDRLELIVGSPC